MKVKLTDKVSQYWLDAYDEPDENKRVELWKKGANEGDVYCFASLGEHYAMSDSPDKNLKLGMEYLKPAAEFGNEMACYDLALAYSQSDEDNAVDECIKWMCKAAVKCYIPAFTYIETFYADERDLRPLVKKEMSPAVKEVDNKKELDLDDYCFKGLLYEYGIIYPKDHNKAMENIKKAADMGHSLCESVLDNEKLLVHKVETVKRVSEESAKETQEHNAGKSNSNKTESYYSKANKTENLKSKVDILKEGIKCGEVLCMYEMGHIFFKGAESFINKIDSYKYDDYKYNPTVREFYDNLKESLDTAEKYLTMAANKGDKNAPFEVAQVKVFWGMYKSKIGEYMSSFEMYSEEVPTWLCKSAEKGDERAFLMLKDGKNKEIADKSLEKNALTLLRKENKTEKDYYHLSLYYIYGIVFKKDFNEVKTLCEKGVELNSKGKCAEVLARACYDLNLQKEGMTNDDYEAKLLEKSVEKETRKESEYPKTFTNVFGILFGSLVLGAVLCFVVSLIFHKLPLMAWPIASGVVFLILSRILEYPIHKIIIVGVLFVAVVGGVQYKFVQLKTEMTGNEKDIAYTWLRNNSDAGTYEKLKIYNNGNYKCNTYYNSENGYVYFTNDGNSVKMLLYAREDSDATPFEDVVTVIEGEECFAVPLGKYYYVPYSENEALLVDEQGRKLKIDIDAESMDIENIAELLKKQHTDSITNKELITLLHSQLFGAEPLCAFFPEQMIAYFREGDENGMKMLEYNLNTNEKMEIVDGVNSTTGIIDTDTSRVMYNQEDRTVYFYDYANSKKITLISDIEEPRFINYIKINGDVYIGVNLQDGSTVVYSRNHNASSTISASEFKADTVTFLDTDKYLLLYFDGDTVGYRTYKYQSE